MFLPRFLQRYIFYFREFRGFFQEKKIINLIYHRFLFIESNISPVNQLHWFDNASWNAGESIKKLMIDLEWSTLKVLIRSLRITLVYIICRYTCVKEPFTYKVRMGTVHFYSNLCFFNFFSSSLILSPKIRCTALSYTYMYTLRMTHLHFLSIMSFFFECDGWYISTLFCVRASGKEIDICICIYMYATLKYDEVKAPFCLYISIYALFFEVGCFSLSYECWTYTCDYLLECMQASIWVHIGLKCGEGWRGGGK